MAYYCLAKKAGNDVTHVIHRILPNPCKILPNYEEIINLGYHKSNMSASSYAKLNFPNISRDMENCVECCMSSTP